MSVSHVAEPAVTGATRPHDQEGCRVSGKAFPKVGASGFLANRVKAAVI